MSTLTLVSAPAVEPIALYEARNFCKVDTDEDDESDTDDASAKS